MWSDTEKTAVTPDFRAGGGQRSYDAVLHEWTARSHTSATYDGGTPREVWRVAQPFGNHNSGRIAFHPFVPPGAPDHGLLYVNVVDGGSGGDPFGNAQRA